MTDVNPSYVEHVLEHYRTEAKERGISEQSTMADATTREKELRAISALLRFVTGGNVQKARVLEIGCGNGVLQARLVKEYPGIELTGLEFSPEMAALARSRELPRVEIIDGDVRKMPFLAASYDVVLSERCIINLMDRSHQVQALSEVARVLRPGGHFVCIEAFTDGHSAMNEARQELGLAPLPQAHHNLWLEKEWFYLTVEQHFSVVELKALPDLPPSNFLSSHYFMSRVVYPAITRSAVRHNTHFVRFFSFLQPIGHYSPIQLFLLRRR